MSEKITKQEFLSYLKSVSELEELRCKQNILIKEYADYSSEPVEPPVYKNVATLGLITLPITWIIFDVFAFYMGSPIVGGIATGLTVALIFFALILKKREKKLNAQTRERYLKYIQKYEINRKLQEVSGETGRLLALLYDKNVLYPRFQNVTAEKNIYHMLIENQCLELSGTESVFHMYDRERTKGSVRDWEKEIYIDAGNIDEAGKFLAEADRKNKEIEQTL